VLRVIDLPGNGQDGTRLQLYANTLEQEFTCYLTRDAATQLL